MWRAWGKASFFLACVSPAVVWAQASPLLPSSAAEPAAAQELFDEARGLIAEHKYTEACPKLEESQRLDPGIGTQFNLAACYEAIGRSASAWSLFLEVAAAAKRAGQHQREQVARERATKLEPKLSRLRISVPESVRCAGLRIVRAGSVVGDAQWDVALPTDPGTYLISASAPGRQTWQAEVQVPAAEITTLTVAPLGAASEKDRDQALAKAGPSTGQLAEHGLGTQRYIALGLGGGAVAGLIVGGVFALSALHEYDASKALCRNDCTPAGYAQRQDALANGNRATVAFVAAGALAATAVTLYLTGARSGGPADETRVQLRPVLGPGRAGALLGGAL